MDWTVESVEVLPDGSVTAAVLASGDTRVRLVHPESVLTSVARMDPMGQMIGSVFAEMFVGTRLTPGELRLRQAVHAARLAFTQAELARSGAPKKNSGAPKKKRK